MTNEIMEEVFVLVAVVIENFDEQFCRAMGLQEIALSRNR